MTIRNRSARMRRDHKPPSSEIHFAIAPVLLGGRERLFDGVDPRALGYECVKFVASEKATHVVLRRGDA